MKRKICILFLVLLTQYTKAQSDFNKDQQLVYTYLYSKDYENAKSIIDNNLLKSDDIHNKIIGYVLLADYYRSIKKEVESIEALEKAKALARKNKNKVDIAFVEYGYAQYYDKINQQELFLKSINKSINEMSKHKNENFILTQMYFLRFSNKLRKSLESGFRSDVINANKHALLAKNNLQINFTFNNLGYYYQKQFEDTNNKKFLDSSVTSYNNAYKYALLIKEESVRNRCLVVHYLNKSSSIIKTSKEYPHEESLKYSMQALNIGKNSPNCSDIVALIYINIGDSYFKREEFETAKNYFLKAEELAMNDNKIFPAHKIIILNNLSITYEHLDQLDKALEYERKVKEFIQQNDQEQFDNNTKSLEIFYNTEQKNQQIKQLEEKNQIYSKQKFLYIGIILLAIAGVIFLMYMLYYKLKSNKQKTDLLEAERYEAELNLELEKQEKARIKAEQELLALQQEQLNKQALATSLQLKQKNSFLNELKEKIKDKEALNLDRILKDERLMDDDFNEIQNIIKEVHPNFFNKLSEVSKSKLTNQDMKYAAYLYLNMDNVQIANVMKVETKTVRMAKYRLKQKIGLEKEADLQTFIQSLFS